MCDLTQGFRLCSCAANELAPEDIGWVLRRQDPKKKYPKIMGKPFMPTFSGTDLEIKQQLLHLLNTTACFDFEYQPKRFDFLQLRVNLPNHTWFRFSYQNDAWIDDRSTKFSSWRQQLVSYNKGKISTDL